MAGAFSEFLRDVEHALGDGSAEYDEFVQLIEAYRFRRTGVVRCRSRIEEILKDHPILLDQFNSSIEQGNQEPFPSRQDKFQKALCFLCKVKNRFSGDHRYMTFLNTVLAYKVGTFDTVPMYREMQRIFTGNLDLLDEFAAYLPPTTRRILQ